jgi:hypothetical protein
MSEQEEKMTEDPYPAIRESCATHHCPSYAAKLNECSDRVNAAEKTEETCVEEFFDLMECVDHCVCVKGLILV